MYSKSIFLYLIILLTVAACQNSSTDVSLPTLAELPTAMPTVTREIQVIEATQPPTATLTPTVTPEQRIVTAQPSLTPATPTATATLLPDLFSYGRSVQGRDLAAYRIGEGRAVIMLVGGIHAGGEAITVRLMEQFVEHFRDTPDDIAPELSLIIIPSMNPDGYFLGDTSVGRFNANNVDLNRNWDCGWEPEAFWGEVEVDPGDEPFSEPETIALGGLIQQIQPQAVLFYHAAANGIFAGNCGGENGSDDLALIYGEASGYPYGQPFTDYVVTGTAPAWVNSIGIPSVDVELSSASDTEYLENLAGVRAVQQWVIANLRISN